MNVRTALASDALTAASCIVGDVHDTLDDVTTLLVERRADAPALRSLTITRLSERACASVHAWVRGLRRLYLYGARLGDDGCVALAPALATSTSLETLDVSACYIFERGAFALAVALRTNTTLRHLNVSRNMFLSPLLVVLGDAIATNASLRTLGIVDVCMSTSLFLSLLRALERHPSLVRVDMSDNSSALYDVDDVPFRLDDNDVLRELLVYNMPYATRPFLRALVTSTSVTSFTMTNAGHERALLRMLHNNRSLRSLRVFGGWKEQASHLRTVLEVNETLVALDWHATESMPGVHEAVRRNAERRYVRTYILLRCRPELRLACGAREIFVRIASAVLRAVGTPPTRKRTRDQP